MGFFKGLQDYVGLTFYTEENFSIKFSDKENPIAEIEKKLSQRVFNPDVKNIAMYITPGTMELSIVMQMVIHFL